MAQLLTTLIPRIRRAVEGVGQPAVLSDQDVETIAADAISSIIFFTEGAWGHTLSVTEREGTYNSPIHWSIDPDLTEAEETLIATQAALDFLYVSLSSVKTSEKISDEGQSWEWTVSANTVRDRMAQLKSDRDRAIAIITSAEVHFESYVSFIAIRDRAAAVCIEPWVDGIGYGYESLMR